MSLRIGWFSTGRGQGSRDLLTAAVRAIEAGDLDAEIAFVFCNRERGEHDATDGFLDLAESHQIPTITRSSRQFRRARGGALSQPEEPLPAWRAEYDREVAKLIAHHPFDIGILAGYMLILTPAMAGRYPFLNLHPAEPFGPVGTWQQVIWELIDKRAEQSGIMIHLATDKLDRGPIVSYCNYPLHDPNLDPLWDEIGHRSSSELQKDIGADLPLFRALRAKGAARELPFIIETLRAFAGGRLSVQRGRVVDASGQALEGGLDLGPEVEAAMRDRAAASADS